MNLDAQRAARRAAMPITSALLDEYAEFGAKVIYASENGIVFGRPSAGDEFTIPPNYFPMRDYARKVREK